MNSPRFRDALSTDGRLCVARADRPSPLHGNVQVVNLFPQGVPIQSQQLGRLDLVTLGFLKRSGDQRPLNGRNQHGMEIPPRSVPHSFDEVAHLSLDKVFKGGGGLSIGDVRL